MTGINLPLIPVPASMRPAAGAPLDLSAARAFRPSGGVAAGRVAAFLASRGWRRSLDGVPISSRIEAGWERGAFRLTVTAQGIELAAADDDALAAAAATFAQAAMLCDGQLGVVIEDAPRFAWRGLSIDIARSFFAPATLRKVAGLAAFYRLNRLHLHLTDDQGWRIEIPQRPELTAISGRTAVAGGKAGYLSTADYLDLDRYCAERGITLVPEIDVPGHTNAALHASPPLNPGGQAPPPYAGQDVGFSRLHDSLPATHEFLRDVFASVAELTSGPYLHIGGDEAFALDDGEYRAIVTAALDAVRRTGKSPLGWQEISPCVAGPGTLVQYWDTNKPATALVAAAERGARVILSPGDRAYLDMKYHADDDGQDWAGVVSLSRSLEWDATTLLADQGLAPDAIEGVEAAIFTEFIHSEEQLFGMLLPRLAGIAEIAWHGQASGGAAGGVAALRRRIEAHRAAWRDLALPLSWGTHAWS